MDTQSWRIEAMRFVFKGITEKYRKTSNENLAFHDIIVLYKMMEEIMNQVPLQTAAEAASELSIL